MNGPGIIKHCTFCGHADEYPLDAKTIAFELYDSELYSKKACTACGRISINYTTRHPAIDKSLLDIWGQDEDLLFLPQDEDLFLSAPALLEIVLAGLDEDSYLETKMYTLVYTLLVSIYDAQRTGQKELYERTMAEALKRKALLEKYKIRKDYITKVVYPLLEIDGFGKKTV